MLGCLLKWDQLQDTSEVFPNVHGRSAYHFTLTVLLYHNMLGQQNGHPSGVKHISHLTSDMCRRPPRPNTANGQQTITMCAISLCCMGRQLHAQHVVHTTSVFAQLWQAGKCLTEWCLLVQKVVFADLSTESVSALSAELARQYPRYIMSLKGTEAACSRAGQWLFQVVKVTTCTSCC